MDYFEEISSKLLEEQGYWIRRSLKIDLSKEEKRDIGKHTIPRPEIDIVALDFRKNMVVAFEAKSFLDSPGVDYEELVKEHEVPEGRYKIFTCQNYREIVLRKLKEQLIAIGMANEKTQVSLGLIAGKVQKKKEEAIRELFNQRGWVFWSPSDVREKVVKLTEMGYENHAAVITAKILLRSVK